ncbi:MAG: hypothetical protein COA43_08075 [Robiginitomaculum sp.]|nr:MAG: hypothetical protein COA43_08075 [Robiginitomaculum sp.]
MQFLKINEKKCKSRYGFSPASRYLVVKTDTDGQAHNLPRTLNMGKINLRGLRFGIIGAATVFGLLTANLAHAAEKQHALNISEQSVAGALNQLAQQTGAVLIFPYDLVETKQANSLAGVYDISEALEFLLKGSGLAGSLTESGVIVIAREKDAKASHREEDIVVGKQIKNTLLAGASALVISSVAVPAMAQTEEAVSTTRDVVRAKGLFGTGETVIVSGVVFAEGSQARLPGALIKIEETGQTGSTDDLGRFRLTNVAPGEYTLSVDYLGFAPQSVFITVDGSKEITQQFSLIGGTDENGVYVYGSRSARAQALNQERTSSVVSTVLSSDLLGNFTGTTLSESLRRAPGVVFQRDVNTGDGTNVVIRGFAPDFNVVKMNGIELPDGTGVGRSASLGNILTESISKVTIYKTLLPSQDSGGTGGLVDIETKTPFDRDKRYASFTLEGAKRARGFNKELLAAGTVSGTFGKNDQFGLSASLQYRERDYKRISYAAGLSFGQYLPLQVDGTPRIPALSWVDPRLPFAFEPGVDEVYPYTLNMSRAEGEVENLALTLSGAWKIGGHSELFFDYQRLERKSTDYSSNLDLTAPGHYPLNDVVALDGEPRRALEWFNRILRVYPSYSYSPDAQSLTDVFTLRGETDAGNWNFNYLGGYTKGTTGNTSYSLRASVPELNITADELLLEATHSIEGRVLSPFPIRMSGDSSFPEPLFTAAGFDHINDLGGYNFSRVYKTHKDGLNERFNGEMSARYNFDNARFKYLEAGIAYERSEFSDSLPINEYHTAIVGLTFNDLGLVPISGALSDIGVGTSINQLSRSDVVSFLLDEVPTFSELCEPQYDLYLEFGLVPPGARCSDGTKLYIRDRAEDPRTLDEYTREAEFAAYLQGALEFGKLEIIGGVRMVRTNIESVNLVGPIIYDANGNFDSNFYDQNNALVAEDVEQTDFLPRVVANYRHNDNLIFRGGYYLSIARPQISLLSSTPSISLNLRPNSGPDGNQPSLSVIKGNPDLKPARTHSFDFSAEYYDEAVGVLKLGTFYKRTDNLLESSISQGRGVLAQVASILPSDNRFQDVINSPEDYNIFISTPNNNENPAHLWGIETSIEKQFTFLPGVLKGLGAFANYTYTSSSKDQPETWTRKPVLDGDGNITGYETIEYIIPNVRYNGQAKHSGTFGLTYNQYGVDANLAYTYQARRQQGHSGYNLHRFEESYGTVDFRASYQFDKGPGQYRVYIEGTDLTRGPEDAALQSTIGADDGITGKYFTGGTYYGGRQLRVGVSGTF